MTSTIPDLNERQLGWSDVMRTAIDNRQLRNALDRKLTTIGHKHRSGWTFSLTEWFMLDVAKALTSVWLPISTALKIAERVGPDLPKFILCIFDTQKDDELNVPELMLHVVNLQDSVAISYSLDGRSWPAEGKETGRKHATLSPVVTVNLAQAVERMLAFSRQELVLFNDDDEWQPTKIALS